MRALVAPWIFVWVGVAALAIGCGGDDFVPAPPTGAGGGAGAGGGNGAGGGATGGGGGVPGCDVTLSPADDDCVIGEELGVFVSASQGDDGNVGSREAPVKSLAKAVELADSQGKRVYACHEQYDLAEPLLIPGGVHIYGGFRCSGWSYDPEAQARVALAGGKEGIPVRLGGGTDTVLSDLQVTAHDAGPVSASSIALVAEGVTATMVRVTLAAGLALSGAAGSSEQSPAQAGAKGSDGANAWCSDQSEGSAPGGAAVSACGSTGGKGGDGGKASQDAGSGSPGAPANPAKPKDGVGGLGQTLLLPQWTCATHGYGRNGAAGERGMVGAGAVGFGTIDAQGYAGAAGDPGGDGTTAQGGGGGGGAKVQSGCAGFYKVGPAGGGGGSGGCPGKGGGAGGPGGSSIAVSSLGSSLVFVDSKLIAHDGGAGGPGGDGQKGGAGGPGGGGGGSTNLKGCVGGVGGKGGDGGPGGGGQGGHSLGVAFTGSAPVLDNTVVSLGAAGPGGTGGEGDLFLDGAAGQAGEKLAFDL